MIYSIWLKEVSNDFFVSEFIFIILECVLADTLMKTLHAKRTRSLLYVVFSSSEFFILPSERRRLPCL